MPQRAGVPNRRKAQGRRTENGHTPEPQAPVETAPVDPLPEPNTVQDPLTAPIPSNVQQPEPTLKPGEKLDTETGEITEPGTRPEFKLNKGHGWIFYAVGREDTFIFAGHMRFTEENEQGKRIEGRLTPEGWEFTVMEFGDKNWTRYGTFKMPKLGDQRYVEQWVDIPIEALDQQPTEEHKTFRAKVRMWKGKERYDGRPSLRIILPDLAKDSPTAVRNKIPM